MLINAAGAVAVGVNLLSTALSKGVKLVAIAVAIALWDAVATADAALVKDVSSQSRSRQECLNSTFVDGAGPLPCNVGADARVDVVADAVAVVTSHGHSPSAS